MWINFLSIALSRHLIYIINLYRLFGVFKPSMIAYTYYHPPGSQDYQGGFQRIRLVANEVKLISALAFSLKDSKL